MLLYLVITSNLLISDFADGQCFFRKQPVWISPSTRSVTESLSFTTAAWSKPLNWRILQCRSSSGCWLCATLWCQRRRVKVEHTHSPVGVAAKTATTLRCSPPNVSVNMKDIWCTRPSHLMREHWSPPHETLGLSSGLEPLRPSRCMRWDELSPTSCWPSWTSTTCAREWVSLVRSSLPTASLKFTGSCTLMI